MVYYFVTEYLETNRVSAVNYKRAINAFGEPGVVDRPFGLLGHAVRRSAGIGQVGPGEAVEGLVDRHGLGEARGGVIEVDHGSLQLPTNWA